MQIGDIGDLACHPSTIRKRKDTGYCKECGQKLNMYNMTEYCMVHWDKALENKCLSAYEMRLKQCNKSKRKKYARFRADR